MDPIQVIRAKTKNIHQELEDLPCMQHLLHGKCSSSTYTDILNAFYQTHLTIRHNIQGIIKNNYLQSLDLKISALIQDLKYFDHFKISYQTIPKPIQHPLNTWGILYVLEGSNKGSLIISKVLFNNHNYAQTTGAQYFNLYCEQVSERWEEFSKQFCKQLNSDGELNQAVETAIIVFKLFKTNLSLVGVHK